MPSLPTTGTDEDEGTPEKAMVVACNHRPIIILQAGVFNEPQNRLPVGPGPGDIGLVRRISNRQVVSLLAEVVFTGHIVTSKARAPESRIFSKPYSAGCRIESGMTISR